MLFSSSRKKLVKYLKTTF